MTCPYIVWSKHYKMRGYVGYTTPTHVFVRFETTDLFQPKTILFTRKTFNEEVEVYDKEKHHA